MLLPPRLPRTAFLIALAVPALLLGAACSDEDEEAVRDAAGSAATSVSGAASSAGTTVAGAATQVATQAAGAVTQVATTASGAATTASGAVGGGSGRDTNIQQFRYETPLTVSRGTRVTWTNRDSTPHTVTGEGEGGPRSGDIAPGSNYSFTFDRAGTFNYVCSIHASMRGQVIVQ